MSKGSYCILVYFNLKWIIFLYHFFNQFVMNVRSLVLVDSQAIASNNSDLLSIGHFGTNFSDYSIKMKKTKSSTKNAFQNVAYKMLAISFSINATPQRTSHFMFSPIGVISCFLLLESYHVFSYGLLFLYFAYFPHSFTTQEINTKIPMSWAHKQSPNPTHTLSSIYT